jgi:hypothetical protein
MRTASIIAFVALAATAGCTYVTPVTTEKQGPTISFTQTSVGAISGLSYPVSSSTKAFFNTIATDPGGVQTLLLLFPSSPQACVTSNGGLGSSFNYSPVPPSQSVGPAPNAMGQVPTELFLVSTLQGPFTCTGSFGPGFPSGIIATAQATNYSGQPTTVQFPITFQ